MGLHGIKNIVDFIDGSNTFSSREQAISEFGAGIRRFGFEHYIISSLKTCGTAAQPLIIATNWPEEWKARYLSQRYVLHDPVAQWAVLRSRPFEWEVARRASSFSKTVHRLNGEAREHGLVDGAVIPYVGSRHVISVSSRHKIDFSPRTELGLVMMTAYLNMALDRLGCDGKAPLTNREREVLHWAASGKTAWETSEILSIAEGTVQNHLCNIRRKMEVTTTTQAVAHAILSGDIRP
ncbi:LuxR family transcriptional regulator [Limoniibacter endophyticus]|uniref:Autoinducer-binding protein n=1 Tax=Limoniibacter endophyticus TaxID=1565040 RepID=A0A8J3GI42_9HYPH|nr:LuxR family transcriptional regulator [Limoniibacter endophyticus]GHC79074.1 autoinducer-binding protein [Limoniibacter endophyticus]